MQAALGLEVSAGRPADDGRLAVLQRHIAVEGVHRALAGFDDVGMGRLQAEPPAGPVVEQDAGAGGDKPGTESVGKTVDPGNAVARAVGHAKIGGIVVPANRLRGVG